jgi:AraC-like DNA-binding protein
MATLSAVPDRLPLERVRAWMLVRGGSDGHVSIADPTMCFYRFSSPTTFVKAASFGLTLGVVVQGKKQVNVEGAAIDVDPLRAIVLTREVEHTSAVLFASKERPYLGLSLCFTAESVARALVALAEAGGETTADTAAAFVMPVDDPLADAIARLLAALDDPLDRKILSPLVTDEILYRLLRSDAAAAVRRAVGQRADAQRILESMQYIRRRHADKLTVEALARRAAMSPSHFAHRFTAVARMSPMRFVREVRLERARTLLFESGARAGHVGVQVGFESAAHFAREFKRRYGAPPSRFMRAG